MKKIIEIVHIEDWVKEGKLHHRTHAVLETGEEAVGYGSDYDLGDKVEYWFDNRWGVTKMQKPLDNTKE